MIDWDRLHKDSGLGQHDRVRQELHLLGIVSAPILPGGYLNAAGWAAEGFPEGLSIERARMHWTETNIDAQDLSHNAEDLAGPYYQIDTSWGGSFRCPKLGSSSLPIDTQNFAPGLAVFWDRDDVTLDDGTLLHRVILKASNPRLFFGHPGGNGPPPNAPQFGPQKPAPPPDRQARPPRVPQRQSIFIQCAYDISTKDAEFKALEDRLHTEKENLTVENEQSLANLRRNLWAISSLTFLATVIGSFVLVRQGLLPVHRLCDAMDEISPKDFRLPLDATKLPAELRPIADRLSHTLMMLKCAFAREKQSTADISHELRTPLAALLTTTELALRKLRTNEEYREFLNDCMLSARQINKAVERLLTLARLDAGVEQLRPREVAVDEIARECSAVIRPLAEARGLSLHLSCDPATLRTDPDKLREIINNLLHNAIQYNQPGGSIDLRVRPQDNGAVIEVVDTGIGISAEARPQIFERLYRADRSRHRWAPRRPWLGDRERIPRTHSWQNRGGKRRRRGEHFSHFVGNTPGDGMTRSDRPHALIDSQSKIAT